MTAEAELIRLRSSEGAVFPVHKWLLVNTSNVFREVLSSVSPNESEIKLTETNDEVLLLTNALYGQCLSPPAGLELEGGAITWETVAKTATLADKFDISRLLKSCATIMATSGITCLESQPSSETGLQTALSWIKLARRLGLEAVTKAVAGLLGRMFFAWNVKDMLKEVAAEMDSASFLEVVSNITENTDSTPTASQPSRTASQDIDADDQQRPLQAVAPPHFPHRFHHFGGGPEPLLGYAAHPMHVAAPLVPVSLW